MNDYDFLVSDISSIKGIGTKTTKLFKKKIIYLKNLSILLLKMGLKGQSIFIET